MKIYLLVDNIHNVAYDCISFEDIDVYFAENYPDYYLVNEDGVVGEHNMSDGYIDVIYMGDIAKRDYKINEFPFDDVEDLLVHDHYGWEETNYEYED